MERRKKLFGVVVMLFGGNVMLAVTSMQTLALGPIRQGTNCGQGSCNFPLNEWIPPNEVCGQTLLIRCCFPSQIGWWGDANRDGVYDTSICCPIPEPGCNWTAAWAGPEGLKSHLTCICLSNPCPPGSLEPCD